MKEINPCSCGNTMCGVAPINLFGESFYIVKCLICNSEGFIGDSENDAITLWNREHPIEDGKQSRS